MTILVTAFDPFNQEATNASQLVLDELKTKVEIQTQLLPTSFHRCYPILRQAVASYKPDAVILLGEAEGRPHVSLERIAINLDDARIADNDGVQLCKIPIEKKGPDGLFTRLPIDAMVEELQATEYPVGISNTAGTFVCNHIMYEALYHLPQTLPVGFIHVPILREQGYETEFQFEKEVVVSTMVQIIEALKKRLTAVE
jgi:pyroglutamyl-peptidase